MPYQPQRLNSFKDKQRTATITKVDPQSKLVDLKYTTQDGNAVNVELPYTNVGVSWGRLFMPQVGDRVIVDYAQGELPFITGMSALNKDYLPYLDPGELVDMNSDGSYVHMRNARRRVKSTTALIDYNATTGPNGETDIELEPGGVVMGIRSKQDTNSKAPRWYEHSYLSMFDNGDVTIQSRYRQKERGLLYMDGTSGYVFLTAGDGRPQEYIELDPLMKVITLLSDGDIHIHSQGHFKQTTYGDVKHNVVGAMQINAGVAASAIPIDFDQSTADTSLTPGDIQMNNKTSRVTISDTLKKVTTAITTGDMHVVDGTNTKISSTLATGHTHYLDGIANKISTELPSGMLHTLDGATGEATTLAAQIGFGQYPSELASTDAALTKAHLNTFENTIHTQRLLDMIKLTTTLIGTNSLQNPGAALAAVNALNLGHMGVPNGSPIVKMVSS